MFNGVGGFTIPKSQPPQTPHSHVAHPRASKDQIAPGSITYTTSTYPDAAPIVIVHGDNPRSTYPDAAPIFIIGDKDNPRSTYPNAAPIFIVGDSSPHSTYPNAPPIIIIPEDNPRSTYPNAAPIVIAGDNPRSTYLRGPDPIARAASLYVTRAPSPNPSAESSQLSAPRAFSRPPNATQPYTPFGMMRIQDMDQFYTQIPSMPLVLDTHDICHKDWNIFVNDLALAWTGKMPLPEFATGLPPKRSSLVADLINLWNDSFFRTRRVEIILYKGRERRSGLLAGTVDELPLPESKRAKGASGSPVAVPRPPATIRDRTVIQREGGRRNS
ncbi:hypothetical protein DFH29DRAFT_999448 [Suillus ampliporus]|nr:hypothetical protein DFH29DRAFT_999448 [Suillus ampliporus]